MLYPFSLRDTVLRLAERELYVVRWSDRILDEVRRNLIEKRISREVAGLLQAMRNVVPEAAVPDEAIRRLEAVMTNDPKDRHVLAAAVAARAEAIVTFDNNHFSEQACAPYVVTPIHPNVFLMTPHGIAPDIAAQVSTEQPVDLVTHPSPVRNWLRA